MWSKLDISMMSRAIRLAKKGLYTTRPNPSVGCVIVSEHSIVGEGFHQRAGEAHAEVHALAMAQDKSQGATAYVTLEPCSHYGRTPPCALALINAGVQRVVVAMTDPNPQVAGRGITMLEEAGIHVEVGLLEQQAIALNRGFIKRMQTNTPYVTVKLAASLDGKTALSNGESKWITGPEARQDVQRLRARHCALVTGIETVLVDNPKLNVRHQQLGELANTIAESEVIQPTRVILDSRARLTADYAVFDVTSPLILVSCCDYSDQQKPQWGDNVTHWLLPDNQGRVDLNALLIKLGTQFNTILVEAGATLAGAFIDAALVDEVMLYQAPKILGGHGRNLLTLKDFSSMDDIPAVEVIDERKVGKDTRLTLILGN